MIKMGSGLHDNNKLSIMLAMISTIIIMMIVMIKMGLVCMATGNVRRGPA